MASEEANNNNKLEFLYNAISDTQETIRFTDTKAGAVFIIAMGLLAGIIALFEIYRTDFSQLSYFARIIVICGSLSFLMCLFISIIIALKSISPTTNPKDHIDLEKWTGNGNLNYYLCGIIPAIRWEDYFWELKDSKLCGNLNDIYHEVIQSSDDDLFHVLVMELCKLSYIKEKKIIRTKSAVRWIEYCLWTAIITVSLTFALNNITFSLEFAYPSWNYSLFICLIVGHVVGDYLLQTEWQAENKKKNWKALILHSSIYTLSVYILSLLSGGIFVPSLIIILFTHIVIDRSTLVTWWIKIVKRASGEKPLLSFLVDQSLHVLVLLIMSIFF